MKFLFELTMTRIAYTLGQIVDITCRCVLLGEFPNAGIKCRHGENIQWQVLLPDCRCLHRHAHDMTRHFCCMLQCSMYDTFNLFDSSKCFHSPCSKPFETYSGNFNMSKELLKKRFCHYREQWSLENFLAKHSLYCLSFQLFLGQ